MMKITNISLAAFFILSGVPCDNIAAQAVRSDISIKAINHPFLIVNMEHFRALREKAVHEPWKSLKADAVARSAAGTSDHYYDLQDFVGAAALSYILDEENSATHALRVRDAILDQYAKVRIFEGDWGHRVGPLGSFFVAILSLDIVYDALSPEDIQACERIIEEQISKVNRTGPQPLSRYGTHGTWDIYKGEKTEPDDRYFDEVMYQITPDGVSPVTNHYAWERIGGGDSRVSKSGYMDVLEFTGIDNRYYNNERIRKFQRWLFGSSVNCAKEMAIFGDMLPNQGINNDMLHRRVVNFDMEAAGYAAWLHESTPAIGHILTYILPRQPLPEPVVPSSKIYENGGAFFREPEDDPEGLHAVLYNIKTQAQGHTHNEVNGLALSGCGNRLLVNGGRLTEAVRPAYLNNTLTINGNNHDSKTGNGITGGFTAEGLDFAVGSAGPALGNRMHLRNLILVHASDGAKGYFIVHDQVKAGSNDLVKNYLHPANQTSITEVTPLEQYTACIDHFPTVEGTSVCFYYVTPPKEINIELTQSALPDAYPGYPDHHRMEAVYETDNMGTRDLATIIFPFSQTSAKADFQRTGGKNFNGCSISQGDVIDLLFESSPENLIKESEVAFRAELCLTRCIRDQPVFYLVINGNCFSAGSAGFESDHPVTLYVRGKTGAIISNGAKVKLSGPDAEDLQFDPAVQVLSRGPDFIEIRTEKGTCHFYEN